MIARARVIPSAEARHAKPLAGTVDEATPRRMRRAEAEARDLAERLVRDATARAETLVADARAGAARAAAAALDEARAALEAQMAARWLALHAAERRRFDAEAEPLVPVAVALAERLLGASLALDPSRVTAIARAVIAEAHGTRRATIEAHPADAPILASALTAEGLGLDAIEIRPDEALARGELRLHTEMGTIDARLHPRFERLASALRDALRAQPPGR